MAKGKKTGGRVKGTPNKNNPIKVPLREHSLRYFTPDASGRSDFDRDMEQLDARDRVAAETKLLEFHTAKMQATSVDMNVSGGGITIEDRLVALSGDEGE